MCAGARRRRGAINEVSLLAPRLSGVQSCASASMARCGWPSSSPTACWWRRRPDRPRYNLSASGPIVPIGRTADGADADLRVPPAALARRAALGPGARAPLKFLEAEKRPVAAVADHFEIQRRRAGRYRDRPRNLIDAAARPRTKPLEERILREQFGVTRGRCDAGRVKRGPSDHGRKSVRIIAEDLLSQGRFPLTRTQAEVEEADGARRTLICDLSSRRGGCGAAL